jgi:DNA adenine methylase
MIRYPGGKSKLSNRLIEKFKIAGQFREPFFGGGSIGVKMLDSVKNMWVNDKDYGISCFWNSVAKYPQELIDKIQSFVPSVESFYQIKNELLTEVNQNIVDVGFKKLAIHQISYSGLGVKSGGPLGGEKQESQYKVNCRWSPDYICNKIVKLNKKINSIKFICTNLDFQEVIENTTPCFIYLDPPYFVKGNELYQYGFSLEDHSRLAKSLKETNHSWVLSYDDCSEVRELYNWACIEEISTKYTITNLKNKETGERTATKKGELIIYARN